MQNDTFRSTSSKRQFARATCWGAVITFLISISIVVIRIRGGMTSVDEATLVNAEQQWQQANIRNYDLEIHINERQRRVYRIQVRDSQISALWHNDRLVKQPDRYHAWTVEGMFQTIRTDVDKPQNAIATHLTIRAEFHSSYGFPQRYIRVEHRQQGNNPEISWKIISFDPQTL